MSRAIGDALQKGQTMRQTLTRLGTVSDRGRVSSEVMSAYEAAH